MQGMKSTVKKKNKLEFEARAMGKIECGSKREMNNGNNNEQYG